ncbi:UDP-N-acetylmuramoyl-tripeptide--D-alanyl-D-alanine ligase [Bacillus taeanensis]|uniref:UDP-N-acetylmuramoyl-tripeptide--D-alanyl-D-alanine ligase n=1 Tax=Bacillus taeanensis TaxID=273032 RepID=A0A366XYJ6_9BACI|nr:UDP-N-acetylmuramoyl-tripeptide--D-alanyl-D-alanine ligase [Bacillus taeanensis]RBW70215.1 UDP-N-acetylmuramoyl-tripeptide--D-alanyl-D-alanine ligase [Bacillus taeanensis]
MKQPYSFFESLSTGQRVNSSNNVIIKEIFIDSRKNVQNGLFIPIVGERFDGHEFLLDAVKNGACAAFWQQDKEVPKELPDDFLLFYVKDTLEALQQLAKKYLQHVKPIVLAVTGSNGKTTTKDILAGVLEQRFNVFKTQGNYNNHIGLPLTILAMDEACEALILEMGMSGFGEISFLSQLASPDLAIITNIGESHLEQLKSREGIAKAKMEIVDGLKRNGTVIIDGDEPLLKLRLNKNVLTCGYGNENKYQITEVTGNENGLYFIINNNERFFLPIIGKHNVKNAVYAIAAAQQMNLSFDEIYKGLSSLVMTNMRLEKLKGKQGALLINDAYNASPTSMKAAVEAVKFLEDYKEKVLVLGDMYELGSDEERLHRSVADSIESPITNVIAVGKKGRWIGEAVIDRDNNNIPISFYTTKEEAQSKVESLLSPNTVVLFKASRGLKLETLIEALVD